MVSFTTTGVSDEQLKKIDKFVDKGDSDRSKTVRSIMELAAQFPSPDEARLCLREGLKKDLRK